MKKQITVAALAGLFSVAAFAQASNSQMAPLQGTTMAPAPMVKQTATPPMDQAANGTAPMKHKHHRHHHHHKAAAPNASQS
ncbi:hypothetical protein WK59_28585 [Burkholderia ubonensis]|uniref:hypothetical protein n=1 Tax=Burkholderia ubonensis TaxID=101571 RepID=UPI000755786F|nr:hypothetical protein [Burkholderia ubonensis]KVT95924.1 hypothetical protein WK59_28585 [Burkholderia ubonensis]KVU08813.1 hypothetical protein WK62_06865 [Burkholderia ubonensis]